MAEKEEQSAEEFAAAFAKERSQMGEIVRIMTTDGLVMASAITGTDIVARARRSTTPAPRHRGPGPVWLACSMMGNQLKGDNSLTLQIKGTAPWAASPGVSDSQGNVRGYAVKSPG